MKKYGTSEGVRKSGFCAKIMFVARTCQMKCLTLLQTIINTLQSGSLDFSAVYVNLFRFRKVNAQTKQSMFKVLEIKLEEAKQIKSN